MGDRLAGSSVLAVSTHWQTALLAALLSAGLQCPATRTHAAHRPEASQATPTTDGRDMTTPDQARATGRGGHNEQVAQYLRQIAGALAGADATAEGTLAAAGASRLDRGRRSIDFSPGNASFSFGSLKLDRDTVTPEVPASVTLLAADTGAAVRVADLEHAFGTWRRDVPGVDGYDTWVINLADKYRRPNVRPGRAAAVFVSASLSGDPGAPDTRVTRVLLRRDADP